jgi:hypothetical protein
MTPTASEQHSYADLGVLRQTWSSKSGLLGWSSVVDHQEIGRRYILTALFFLLIGGVEALLLRPQLAKPENTFLAAERYNQIFALHGTTRVGSFALLTHVLVLWTPRGLHHLPAGSRNGFFDGGLMPLEDQQVDGLIMWIGGLILFAEWFRESDRVANARSLDRKREYAA